MTYRKLVLAACAGTGILGAFSIMAMPSGIIQPIVKSAITLIDDDGDHHDGHRVASDDCGSDDDDDGCGHGAIQQRQSATPPANGLFAPGAKPAVQIN